MGCNLSDLSEIWQAPPQHIKFESDTMISTFYQNILTKMCSSIVIFREYTEHILLKWHSLAFPSTCVFLRTTGANSTAPQYTGFSLISTILDVTA